MSLFIWIRNLLQDPRLKGVDVNSDQLLSIHKKILLEKKMMNKVFLHFYTKCKKATKIYFCENGSEIEIGAGVSFFKDVFPEIIATDIKKAENLDKVLDAQNMDLPDESVRAFYGINCFHHFPDPDKFFTELMRTLKPGGGCVLIEPYYGFVASAFYKKLFDTETFSKTQKDWNNSDSEIMTGANQALSYIVFKRDKDKFSEKFPDLEIVIQKPLNNYLQYLISGGLNFRALLPNSFRPIIQIVEFFLTPINVFFALHHIVIIRKKHKNH